MNKDFIKKSNKAVAELEKNGFVFIGRTHTDNFEKVAVEVNGKNQFFKDYTEANEMLNKKKDFVFCVN